MYITGIAEIESNNLNLSNSSLYCHELHLNCDKSLRRLNISNQIISYYKTSEYEYDEQEKKYVKKIKY